MEKHVAGKDEQSVRMLGMLVKITLSYRDELVENNEDAITVGETQKALEAFMMVIKTQKIPVIEDSRIKRLVMKWLEELPKYVHH